MIAAAAAAIDPQGDPVAGLRQVVRTFAKALKFVALAGLLEYLRDPGRRDPSVDRFLSDRNRLLRPSLGHFLELLRLLARSSSGWLQGSALGGLTASINTKGQLVKPLRKALEELLHARNVYFHSLAEPDPDLAGAVFEENLARLQVVLEALDWLADGELVARRGDVEFVCRGVIEQRSARPGAPNGVSWIWGGVTLPMPPFLLEESDSSDAPSLLQYETVQGRWVKYVTGSHVRRVDSPEIREAVAAIVRAAEARNPADRELRAPLARVGERAPSWEELRRSAQHWANRAVSEQIERKKYHHDWYIPRPDLERAFEEFLTADRRLMVIVGASGCGKTNLLCHLTRQSQAQGHVVLHQYARLLSDDGILRALASQLAGAADPDLLRSQLAACAGLPQVVDGARLVLFVDAVNEFPSPGRLFDAVRAFAEDASTPAFVKVVVTCRPIAWESIWQGYTPDRAVVHADAAAGDRAWFVLGGFSSRELSAAWQRRSSARLPEEVRELLRDPVLFQAYVVAHGGDTEGPATLPATPEAVLDARFDRLEAIDRARVEEVVDALWEARKDHLRSDEYTSIDELERWISQEVGDDSLAMYRCPDPALHGPVFDESQIRPGELCSMCGLSLAPYERIPILSPLRRLQEEGLLTRYDTGDDELIRFVFDRMYEVRTAHRAVQVLDSSADASRELGRLVKAAAAPGAESFRSALVLACLMLVADQRQLPGPLSELFAGPAEPALSEFVDRFLAAWQERSPDAAHECIGRRTRRSLRAARRGRLTAELRPCLLATARTLSRQPLSAATRTAALQTLVMTACDPRLTVDWHDSRWQAGPEGHAAAQALGSTSPNDQAFSLLLVHAQERCREDDSEAAVECVVAVVDRYRGLWRLARRGRRLSRTIDWLLRLVAGEAQDQTLIMRSARAIQGLLGTWPLVRPRSGPLSRLARRLVVRAATGPMIRFVDRRIAALVRSIPDRLLQSPGRRGEVKLATFLDLDDEGVAKLRRFNELLADPASPLTEEDHAPIADIAAMAYDSRGGGLLRSAFGSPLSHRGMQDLEAVLGLAESIEAILRERAVAGRPANGAMANQVVWALVHGCTRPGFRPTDEQFAKVEGFVRSLLARNRRYALDRYDASGQFLVNLCPVFFADVTNNDVGLPRAIRFMQELGRDPTSSTSSSPDWAALSRMWDQLVFPALRFPKEVFNMLTRLIEFTNGGEMRICLGDRGSFDVSPDTVRAMAAEHGRRRAPDYDLDSELADGGDRPAAVAATHLLGTLGTAGLSVSAQLAAFVRQSEMPPGWLAIAQDLADPETMRKLRDEKSMTYLGNVLTLTFPATRAIVTAALGRVADHAAGRNGGAQPLPPLSPGQLAGLMGPMLDEVLDLALQGDGAG